MVGSRVGSRPLPAEKPPFLRQITGTQASRPAPHSLGTRSSTSPPPDCFPLRERRGGREKFGEESKAALLSREGPQRLAARPPPPSARGTGCAQAGSVGRAGQRDLFGPGGGSVAPPYGVELLSSVWGGGGASRPRLEDASAPPHLSPAQAFGAFRARPWVPEKEGTRVQAWVIQGAEHTPVRSSFGAVMGTHRWRLVLGTWT